MDQASPATMATLDWIGDVDGHLTMIDQTLLPVEVKQHRLPRRGDRVGSDPLAARARRPGHRRGRGLWRVRRLADRRRQRCRRVSSARLNEVVDYLATSRPTAVNLFWALERMRRRAEALRETVSAARNSRSACWPRPGRSTRKTAPCAGRSASTARHCSRDGQGVLTHCNAGGLATADYGTALAVFFAAQEAGKRLHVYRRRNAAAACRAPG